MEIQTAIDWFGANGAEHQLRTIAAACSWPVAKDLYTMINSCHILVGVLSKEEIECRRRHTQTKKHAELLKEINDRIAHIEMMATMGTLMS
jgi:hypothetical protein